MYEWFLGVENDTYLSITYILHYLDCEELYVWSRWTISYS